MDLTLNILKQPENLRQDYPMRFMRAILSANQSPRLMLADQLQAVTSENMKTSFHEWGERGEQEECLQPNGSHNQSNIQQKRVTQSYSQYSHHPVNGFYRPQAPFKQLHQTLKQKSLPNADNN